MSERDELQQILTELVTVPSAADAERLAEHLRQRGILAIANAAPWPAHVDKMDRGARVPHEDRLRTFVVVAKRDLDRAQAELYAMHTSEGDATDAEIEAALARGDDGEAVDSRRGGPLSRLQRIGETVSPWLGRLFVVAVLGVAAWIVVAAMR